MFVTKLAKVPRSEILNLLPQIRVVKAVKRNTESEKVKEMIVNNEEDEDKYACFTQNKEESPEENKEDEKKNESKRRRRDSIDAPEEILLIPRRKDMTEKKTKGKQTTLAQMNSPRAGRSLNAIETSFGIKKK